MATPYSSIINVFLSKVSDYDLVDFTNRDDIVIGIMKASCAKFTACDVNLSDMDDTLMQFNVDIPFNVIDIIAEGMVAEWLKPKIFNTEILKNSLSTKDFNTYSPANLLKELRETLKLSQDNYRGMVNKYSYEKADFKELGG